MTELSDLVINQIQGYSGKGIRVDEYDKAFQAFELANMPTEKHATLDVSWLSLGGYAMVERHSTSEISQLGKSMENTFSIILPSANRQAEQVFAQQAEGEYQSFIVPPNASSRWLFPANTRSLAMAFDVNTIKKLLSKNEYSAFNENARELKRSNLNFHKLHKISQQYSQLIQHNIRTDVTPDKLEKYLNALAGELLLLVNPLGKCSKSDKRSSYILSKAIEYIKGHYQQTISIGNVADYANTTVRNLQHKFKAQMALSPQQFLHCYRLYQFHRLLEYSQTVESAAYACGFRHMGRAAIQYKQTYGMAPSQYLKTSRKSSFFGWLSHHPANAFI